MPFVVNGSWCGRNRSFNSTLALYDQFLGVDEVAVYTLLSLLNAYTSTYLMKIPSSQLQHRWSSPNLHDWGMYTRSRAEAIPHPPHLLKTHHQKWTYEVCWFNSVSAYHNWRKWAGWLCKMLSGLQNLTDTGICFDDHEESWEVMRGHMGRDMMVWAMPIEQTSP